MGLFDFLFRADITRDWVADEQLDPEFNFDDLTLCGAQLGDRAESLRGLGPPDDRGAARKGLLRYHSLGLQVVTAQELLVGFEFVWIWPNDLDTPFESFAGKCTQNGRVWPLHRETNFLDFTVRLGEPHRLEEDDVGKVFVYQFGAVMLEIEFDELDLLSSITVLPRE